MSKAVCTYCIRNDAEFVDLDGDPICNDCSTPEPEPNQ